jgi:hypothetical protein
VRLDHLTVTFTLMTGKETALRLAWGDHAMSLPADRLGSFAADLRALYYDALRGRRGRPLAVNADQPVTVSIDNEGAQLYCTLQTGEAGDRTRLHFPATQVPVFLDATQAALAKLERETGA